MPQNRRRRRQEDDSPPEKRPELPLPPPLTIDDGEEEELEVLVVRDDNDEDEFDESSDDDDDEEEEEEDADREFIASDDDEMYEDYDDEDRASEVMDDGGPDKGEISVDAMLSQNLVTRIPSLEEALRTRVFQCAICQSEGESRGPTPNPARQSSSSSPLASAWWKQVAIMQCGHTVCVSCWDQMRHADCPLCKCDVMWIGTYRVQ